MQIVNKGMKIYHTSLVFKVYTVYGILQARILEWVAILFSNQTMLPASWETCTQVKKQVNQIKNNRLVQN